MGSLYILDEPSIGLHVRDTNQLIHVLKELRDLGNTVVVVEHDEEIMRDLIDHVMKNNYVRAGMVYINQKYGRDFMYNAVMKALKNEMICGTYRGNPNYCEPYITREEFNQLQKIISRNPRTTGPTCRAAHRVRHSGTSCPRSQY